MNEILLKIIESMISHFWILTLTIIITSFLKKCLFVFIELQKVKYANKDLVKLAISNDQQVLEIQSSNLKIDDIKKLKEQKTLEFKNSA